MFSLTLPEFVVGGFLRLAVKPVLGPPFPVGVQRIWLEVASLLSRSPSGVKSAGTELGGVPAVSLSAANQEANGVVVLYLHGGAFVVGSHRTHAGLTGYLAKAINGTVYAIDYRLAPENPWPAGFDDALTAYRALVSQKGISPDRIVVAGDSAGGVMVADLLLALTDAGEPAPAAGVLLSPAVGIDMERPEHAGPKDTLVTKEWAGQAMALYARPTDSNRILGRDLSKLPPVYLQFSRDEVLAGENRTFLAQLRQAGVTVEAREDRGAFHVLALLPGLMKRARTSIDDVAAFVKRATEGSVRRPQSEPEVA